ncbi:MAG: ATP-binding protein [Candidatus Krumholzibacteriia bacterium]
MTERPKPPPDPRPLQAIADRSKACFDCYSSLSAIIAALDPEGRVVYGNRAFHGEVADWPTGVGEPRHMADLWPLVAAVLPDVTNLDQEGQRTTHVREVQLAPEAAEPRDHLVYLDPIEPTACGKPRGWALTLVDISHIRRAERSSRSNLEIEMFLSRLSSRFVGTTDIEKAIVASLEDIGSLTGSGSAFYTVWQPGDAGLDEFVAWNPHDVERDWSSIPAVAEDLRRWFGEAFTDLEIVELEGLADALPAPVAAAFRQAGDDLAGQLLMVPLCINEVLTGAVGLRYGQSADDTRSSAWIVLDIFCHILERVILLKRSEDALRSTNRELQEKSAQLVQSEKMASIGQMAAGVAHEINNPVGFIMGNLSTLRDYAAQIKAAIDVCKLLGAAAADLPAEIQQAVAALDHDDLDFMRDDLDDLLAESLEGCDRVRDIVQNMKGFARLDDKTASRADLNDCVESTLKVVWNELKYKCEVVKEYGELPQVVCFPGKVNQVIMNLLVNAAHAIEEKGTVTIRTSVSEDQVVLQVADTGCGIPPEALGKLFDPFYTTKEPGKGTGLGLYICHSIMEEHGGSIEVDSTVGLGTTFTVRLPLSGIDTDAEEILV